jgi:xylulokinase
MTTTLEHLIRSCYEGVAFNTRWNLVYVEQFIGKAFPHLRMIGGGAKSSLWCQIFADVMDRVIIQMKDPMHANARGAAFLALMGLNEIILADIPHMVPQMAIFEPRPQYRSLYDTLYQEFKKIYKNNRAMYRRLNQHTMA